jgi:hypothetical protein
MKTAVTMLGEEFRQWQKDWEYSDRGIGDKPKSYDEFISPFIELEKQQIVDAYRIASINNAPNEDMQNIKPEYWQVNAEMWYDKIYHNQNK